MSLNTRHGQEQLPWAGFQFTTYLPTLQVRLPVTSTYIPREQVRLLRLASGALWEPRTVFNTVKHCPSIIISDRPELRKTYKNTNSTTSVTESGWARSTPRFRGHGTKLGLTLPTDRVQGLQSLSCAEGQGEQA